MKQTVEQRLSVIEKRNQRVEQDKAWETSLARRLTISILTYLVVAVYLTVINNDKPWINALVPAIGYFLSTLVLKNIRKLWQK